MNAGHPVCQKCGKRTTKRGFQTYATPPHKRQKYQCQDCGYVFTLAEQPAQPDEQGDKNEADKP